MSRSGAWKFLFRRCYNDARPTALPTNNYHFITLSERKHFPRVPLQS